MTTTQSLVFTSTHHAELRALELAEPGPNQVMIRTHFSVASPGTELRCFAGKQANTRFPIVPGYSSAGVIEKAGKDSGFSEGDRVFSAGGQGFQDITRCWGGHSQRFIQDAHNVARVPDDVSLKSAAIGKIAAIAHHGFQLAHARPGDRIVVLGLGMLGQISARFFTAAGHEVIACDLDASRVATASSAGTNALQIDRDLTPLLQTYEDRADIVIDVTGTAAVIGPALQLLRARPWGDSQEKPPTYLVQGSYIDMMPIPYHTAFSKEAVFMLSRDNGQHDIEAVLDAIANQTLHIDDLLTHVVSPRDAQPAYEALMRQDAQLTTVFDWRQISN